MAENKHTLSDLYQMQSLSLESKIRMTCYRIEQWVDAYGEDGCYVSFSGGKDSTVLLDLVRNECGFRHIPAVFVDVPTQYPELKTFARQFCSERGIELVELKPKISFMEVCKKYGFPLISKEVSETVYYARKHLTELKNRENALASKQASNKVVGAAQMADMLNVERRKGKSTAYQEIVMGNIPSKVIGSFEFCRMNGLDPATYRNSVNARTQILLGEYPHRSKGIESTESSRMYDKSRYKYFLYAPFEISNQCCNVMKKQPIHEYAKKTGRHSITGQMASESRLRTTKWLKNGCNGFEMKEPISNPMSFWTEQDVLLYIKTRNLPICSVYGDVVFDTDAEGQVAGQMDLSEMTQYGVFDTGTRPLKTTGCNRTGCVLCGFGCHLEKEDEARFVRLKETHPGLYGLLDVIENNGVTYRQAIDWVNEHGHLNIKY